MSAGSRLHKLLGAEEFQPVIGDKKPEKKGRVINMPDAVVVTSSLRNRSKSLSDLLSEDDGSITKSTLNAKTKKISRDHWKKGRVLQKCHGCHRQINLVFRRHHCRMCGFIFCHDCSQYKRRLSDDAEPNPDGDFHRVCLYCVIYGEDASLGHTRSWTCDFEEMKRDAQKEKNNVCDQQPEIKLVCEVPVVCLPIIDQFLSDVIKQKRRAVRERLNAAVKAAKREKDCTACDRQIYIPTDRKGCTVCGDIFCKKCSSKDLVVFYPHGTNFRPEDPEVNFQPRIEIQPEGEDISKRAEIWRNYRVCQPCQDHLGTILKVLGFNLNVRDIHIELMDLRSQLLSSLDRVASNADCTKMLPLQEDGFEVVTMTDARMISKLFDRYFSVYNQLSEKVLQPQTPAQVRMLKNMTTAARSFYIEKRGEFRILFDESVLPKAGTDAVDSVRKNTI